MEHDPTLRSTETPAADPLGADAGTWPACTVAGGDLAVLEAHLLGFAPPDALYRRVVPNGTAPSVTPGDRVALRDSEGVVIAALEVVGCDRRDEGWHLAGRVVQIGLPPHDDFSELRLSAAEIRGRVLSQGRTSVLACVPDRVLHAATRAALVDRARSLDATLLVLIPATPGEHDDLDGYFRVRSLERSAAELPNDRSVIAVVPSPHDVDAVWAAMVSRAAGATHLAWDEGRSSGLDPRQARPGEAGEGLVVVPIRPFVYSPQRAAFVADDEQAPPDARRCPPAADVPRWAWTDDAEWLLTQDERAAVRRAYPPPGTRGFTVFFTGLSGSGKSTIARALRLVLMERTGRPVTLLDGDRVRRHLSAGLGFSREDRDRNVLRIGWVAAEISRHGGIALCAPIAPYDAIRRQVRHMIEPVGGFLLVHVATPLEACEARDRKGLYARARAGLLPQFTGISDPYEPPADAAVSIDTRDVSVEAACEAVLQALTSRGYLV